MRQDDEPLKCFLLPALKCNFKDSLWCKRSNSWGGDMSYSYTVHGRTCNGVELGTKLRLNNSVCVCAVRSVMHRPSIAARMAVSAKDYVEARKKFNVPLEPDLSIPSPGKPHRLGFVKGGSRTAAAWMILKCSEMQTPCVPFVRHPSLGLQSAMFPVHHAV